MTAAVEDDLEEIAVEPASVPEVETDSDRISTALDVLARFVSGYSVHNIRTASLDDEGWLSVLVHTEHVGITQDLLNVYASLEDRRPYMRWDGGKVDLMLAGIYEDQPMRFYSVAHDEAALTLKDLTPGAGFDWAPVEIEALWAFVESQESKTEEES